MCYFIIRFKPNYAVLYTWHEPPLPHSSVFKVLASGSKQPGFDDSLALIFIGSSFNGIRAPHAEKQDSKRISEVLFNVRKRREEQWWREDAERL